jgi:hypothetical protein
MPKQLLDTIVQKQCLSVSDNKVINNNRKKQSCSSVLLVNNTHCNLQMKALHESISPATNDTFSYPWLWFPKLTKVQLSIACSTCIKIASLFVITAMFLSVLAPVENIALQKFVRQLLWLQKQVFHLSVFATVQPFASDTSTLMLIGDLNQSDTKSLITIYNLGKPWEGRSTKYYRCQLTANIIIGSLLNNPLLCLETLIFLRNLRGVLQFGSVISLAVLMMICN